MKRKITRLGFLCHPTRTIVPPLLRSILQWARKTHTEIRLERGMAETMGRPDLGVERREMGTQTDVIVVLGGDGSILESVRTFADDRIPIADINLGHLGFLTLGNESKAIPILERIRTGHFRVENRMMLQAVVRRDGLPVFRGIALNDAVIVKGPILRVIDIDVSISGTYVTSYRGDGVIFSTPTGSTAYSLSAGGPIVPPWVNVMILCPLHSHTLSARPVVTSDGETLAAVVSCTHSKVDLVLDGQEGFPLENGDLIEVSRAPETAHVVVFQSRNFFQLLRRKMKWGR